MIIGNTRLIKQPSQQAPEKKKEVEMYLYLRRPGNGALMDDYMRGGDFQVFDSKVMEQNPELYFNFGFDLEKYKSFVIKQMYMRVEKATIREQMVKELRK